MQLIIKDNDIIYFTTNSDNIISNYPDCMNIFIDDNIQIHNVTMQSETKIIPETVFKNKKLSYNTTTKKYEEITVGEKIIFPKIEYQHPFFKTKAVKPLSDLMIQQFISETYHTSTSQIKLDTVTNLHRPVTWIKEDLHKYVALQRWEKEVGGCEWNGWQIHTDRESQSKITAAYIAASQGLRISPSDWKFKHGFESITNEQMISLGGTVLTFVQGIYDKEKELKELIDQCVNLGDINALKPIILTYFD